MREIYQYRARTVKWSQQTSNINFEKTDYNTITISAFNIDYRFWLPDNGATNARY